MMINIFFCPFPVRVFEDGMKRMIRCWCQGCSITYMFDAAFILIECSIACLRTEVRIDPWISRGVIRCYFIVLLIMKGVLTFIVVK